MNTNYNKIGGISYLAGFFLLLGLAIFGLFVGGIISVVIIQGVLHNGTSKIADLLQDPRNSGLSRLLQVISVVFSMLIPPLIIARLIDRRPFWLLGFGRPVKPRQVGLVLLIVFSAMLIAASLGYLNKLIPIPPDMQLKFQKMETDYASQVRTMVDLTSFGKYLMSLVLIAFLPALCEELLFRAGLQNFLTRATRSPVVGIVVVSILFSLVHASFYGFLPRMFLGIMLGLIFYNTKNIWLCVLAHFLNNAISVTQLYYMTQKGIPIEKAMQDDFSFIWGLIALPLFYFLIRALKKATPPQQPLSDQTPVQHGF